MERNKRSKRKVTLREYLAAYSNHKRKSAHHSDFSPEKARRAISLDLFEIKNYLREQIKDEMVFNNVMCKIISLQTNINQYVGNRDHHEHREEDGKVENEKLEDERVLSLRQIVRKENAQRKERKLEEMEPKYQVLQPNAFSNERKGRFLS